MNKRCIRACDRQNHEKGVSNGWRATFYYPGSVDTPLLAPKARYQGCWRNSAQQQYGVQTNPRQQLIYDGGWVAGSRHGYGTMRRQRSDGCEERIYVGEWRNNAKCGEGKQFYTNGTYYGWWLDNRRHGLGIKWYKDGRIYLGEWQADAKHGLGVLFCSNGNRYEGHFARGFKNGEGTFYHLHTGQLQKGMWENDVCKASLMQDAFRNQVTAPTEYPIPRCHMACPDDFVRTLFQKYMCNAYKPAKSFEELKMLNFVRKMRRYAKFEPKAQSNSKFPSGDMQFPCTCQRLEQPVRLRRL